MNLWKSLLNHRREFESSRKSSLRCCSAHTWFTATLQAPYPSAAMPLPTTSTLLLLQRGRIGNPTVSQPWFMFSGINSIWKCSYVLHSRAPVYNSQPQPTGGDIGIAEPRLSHPETHDQQHHYYNNHHHQHTNGATAITVTASKNTVGSNSNSNVVADSRLRHSKKKQSDSSKSTATKQRKSSSSSSSGRQHDNLDIFLSAAPPSDLSSLVSAVSNTQPLSSFSHDQAQAQYLQQQQQQQGSFVPYYERSYPPTSYHRTPLQSDNHVNSSKEVSFSRQLIAPSPNPKNQPIPLPSTGDAMQHTHRPSSHRGRGVTTKAAASLTRRSSQSSLPINAHYDAMHSHNQHKGKPPRYPHTPSHSADDSRIHVVTPSYTQSDSSLRAQANYLNEAPFFQQFEYTGKHPTLTSRSDADLTRSSSSRGASPMRLRSSDPHRAAATGYSGSTRSGSREVTRPRSASAAGGTRASSSRRSSSQSQRLSRSWQQDKDGNGGDRFECLFCCCVHQHLLCSVYVCSVDTAYLQPRLYCSFVSYSNIIMKDSLLRWKWLPFSCSKIVPFFKH